MLTIQFEDKGTVDEVEEKIIQVLKENGAEQPLLLDLTSIQFIQIEALIYLVSFIAKRKTKNFETKIRYFSNDYIKSFLHNARFFETIKNVAGIDIHELAIDLPAYFDKSSFAIDYFLKPKFEFSWEGDSRELSDAERLEYLRDKGYYPLTSLPFSNDIEKSYTLKEEPKKWTEGQPIVSIIQRNLPDKVVIGDKISKHIIYESITNAIRHPQSKRLVISCIRQSNYYTLVIWDNGESIIETLLKELRKGNSIKTEDLIDDFHSCYCIVKEKKSGPPKADYFDYYFSFDVPNLSEPNEEKKYRKEEWFILLSALFPGITRDPKGIDYQESTIFNPKEKPPLTGRGLTYLINTAVRNFGGEVRIRTSNFFINIKKAEKDYKTLPDLFFNNFKNDYYVIDFKDKYDLEGITPNNKKIINSLFRAKIQEFSKAEADFHGNMITIHIPQR